MKVAKSGQKYFYKVIMRQVKVYVLLLGLILISREIWAVAAPQMQVTKGARILVDKAHPAHSDLSPTDFKQIADAGFTVVVQKWSTNLKGNPIDFGEYAKRATTSGLFVMRWESGLMPSTESNDQTGTRSGKTTHYTRPQSQMAWKYLTAKLVKYAKLSKAHPNIKGVLLDFEIYDKNKTDGFCESYDDRSFQEFFINMGFDIPDPLPAVAQRQQYLIKRQMFQMYIGYQIDQITKEAQNLRQSIDAVNSGFQIGIYGWGVLIPPIIHQLATAKAPALILDAQTYGRSTYSSAFEGGYDGNRPDSEALKWSLGVMEKGIQGAHQRYDNVIFLAGHYPQSPGPQDGSQYKFTAKQAFQSAAFGEGYWIWMDAFTPKPWTSRREWFDNVMDYFGKANAALDAKNWNWAKDEPRTVK